MIQRIKDLDQIEKLKDLEDLNICGNPLQTKSNQTFIQHILSKNFKKLKVLNMVEITADFRQR